LEWFTGNKAMKIIKRARELSALAKKATPGTLSVGWIAWLLRFGNKNDGPWTEEVKDHENTPDWDDAPLFAASREMAELLGKLARKLERVVRVVANAGCPPIERCPYEGEVIARDVVCAECWQEWIDKLND